MNTKQKILLIAVYGTLLALALCLGGCAGDAPVPHDEPPPAPVVRPFKEYNLGGEYLTSYVVETADGQRVTCFNLSYVRSGRIVGMSCVAHR